MSLVDDLQILALKAVIDGDSDYNLRFVLRWYSKTFATPLHLVKTLPLPDVIQAFWESRYETMDEDALDDERLKIIETREERVARAIEADKEQMEVEEFMAENSKLVKKPGEIQPPSAIPYIKSMPETSLPDLQDVPIRKLPENMSIRFAPTDFFEEMINKLDTGNEEEG
jgi:hypothetical protein